MTPFNESANNHPGEPVWHPTEREPNWFYYYQQLEGGDDYRYNHDLPNPGMVNLIDGVAELGISCVWNFISGGYHRAIESGIVDGRRVVTGETERLTPYKSFILTLTHEREHVLINAMEGPDEDNDRLPDAFELAVSQTDPFRKYSARDDGTLASIKPPNFGAYRYTDEEVWCDAAGIEAASNVNDANDWANPGPNKGSTNENGGE